MDINLKSLSDKDLAQLYLFIRDELQKRKISLKPNKLKDIFSGTEALRSNLAFTAPSTSVANACRIVSVLLVIGTVSPSNQYA